MKAEDLMSLAEFKELTDCSDSTIYNNKRNKRFPFKIIKLGNRLRFPRAEVYRWIESGAEYCEAGKGV